jgi:hypothetical protein
VASPIPVARRLAASRRISPHLAACNGARRRTTKPLLAAAASSGAPGRATPIRARGAERWSDGRRAQNRRPVYSGVAGFSESNLRRTRRLYADRTSSDFPSHAVRASEQGAIASIDDLAAVREPVIAAPWGHRVHEVFRIDDHTSRADDQRAPSNATSCAPNLLRGPPADRKRTRATDRLGIMPDKKTKPPAKSAEAQVTSFFAKYAAPIAKLGKALRTKLRARLPGLMELVYVYERQDSLVLSYSPTETGSAGVCALALYPDRVRLFFTGGAHLSKADPQGLLQGGGKEVRFVEMTAVADYDRPEIEALVAAALKLGRIDLDAGGKHVTVIKAEAQKKRAARAKKPAKSAAPKKPTKPRRTPRA